ncbi:hypothetical protein MATL_G00049770 [Megalops atlanticus]|uniref:Zinc finger and BTB domain-containing protein 21 n=1 Tax=Megalops atlanticus TaxID=7932 RepID=A0A9D3TF02_MEGAT|nr:hypothetical protein MATL_G00049770 [Megalops atlanticus]
MPGLPQAFLPVNRKAKMESLVHYINPAHAISLLGVLNEQRLKGQLCDVILIVGDQKYQAHKSVLAASSEYFQSLFVRKQSEAQAAVQLDFFKKEHETHCEYKKLTCLECMRTFKSSFSIWRHQVEVHNQNMMTVKEQMSLSLRENNGEVSDHLRPLGPSLEPVSAGTSKEEIVYSDSSGPVMFDSEDSSFMPEDLSIPQHQGELKVKEEPQEEAVDDRAGPASAEAGPEEPGVWPCEKCGKLFSTHKQLERHQELLCHIKPFICHICNKAFRTNFRLWSHFQSHMSTPDEPGARESDKLPSSPSPSPPPATSVAWPPAPRVSSPKSTQLAASETAGSSLTTFKNPEQEKQDNSLLPKADAADKPLTPQESDTLFYHAPTLSALTFKRQYMCKLCHRTFKTAFSLWSHEQSHTNP